MIRFQSLRRLLAAATLILSGVAVVSVASMAPAGAVNETLTFNCGTGYASASLSNSATLTVTVGTACTGFTFAGLNGASPQGTAALNGNPVVASQFTNVVQGNTIVYTAPASGSGEVALTFSAGQSPGDGIVISFPQPTGSLTDNGNGTMTVTYAGSVVGFLFPSGSICADPLTDPSKASFVLSPMAPPGGQLAASPAVIAVGTPLLGLVDSTPIPVTAGSYQACLYETTGGADEPLLSSLAIKLGEVAPAPAPTPDPITPTFTG